MSNSYHANLKIYFVRHQLIILHVYFIIYMFYNRQIK